MTDNEKLIEEAREVVRSWDLKGSWDAYSPIGMLARMADALEAAEKAHTPTDDEREALAFVIEQGWGNPTWDGVTLRPIDRQIADAVLAAGFRRSEVPEPEMLAPGESSACRDCGCPAGSDAALSGGFWCGHECHGAEPQGEPSDARVVSDAASRVALSEFYFHRPGRSELDAMRDAVRAAVEVDTESKGL